jgi:hypothetical protein
VSSRYGGIVDWMLCVLLALVLAPRPRKMETKTLSGFARGLVKVLENGVVLTVLSLLAGVLMIVYPWVLAVLGILLLLGLHRSNAIPRAWRTWYKLLAYVGASFIIVFGLTSFRRAVIKELVPRAYLHVDKVEISITGVNNVPLTIQAHLYGHNVSTVEGTLPDPIVLAAIFVRPPIEPERVSQEEVLFSPSGEWTGPGYIGLNHVLNPLQTFEIYKEESLVNLDSVPFSFETARKIREGTLVIYVVTKAKYSDRWGPRPESRSCTVFSSGRDHSLYHLIRGECWGTYQQ